MRHRKVGRKLKRTASHRRSTLAALATSLLRHKRITTTIAKAKETRMVVEKIITRAKNAVARQGGNGQGVSERQEKFDKAGGHARREVYRFIKDREVINELFSTVAPKVASRPGGYTRVVKLGQRQGDGAQLAVIELVDFNTGQEKAAKSSSTAKEKKSKLPRRTKKQTGIEKAHEAEEPRASKEKKKSTKEPGAKEST
jgi:large subunit ribosomal protein L17